MQLLGLIVGLFGWVLAGGLLDLPPASATSSWTLTGTTRMSVTASYGLRTCRNLAALSIKGSSTTKIRSYRLTYPTSFAANNTIVGDSTNQKAAAQPVYYSGLGMYLYYTLPNAALVRVASWSDSGIIANVNSVTMLSTPYHLLLDPVYPLLYVAGMNFVGMINISSPTTMAILAQYQRLDVMTDAATYQLALIEHGTRLLSSSPYTVTPVTHLYDLGNDLSTFAPSRSLSAACNYCTGFATDPLGKYLLCMGDQIRILQPYSPYSMIGNLEGSPVPTAGTFLGDNLIVTYGTNAMKVFALQNSTWTGTTQLINLVPQTSSVSMSCNTLRSMEWRDGMLYTADSGANVAQSVVVSTTTGLNIASLTRTFPEAQACNKSVGISSMPALAQAATVPLVVDVQNLVPITKSQLWLYDGAKDFRWNAIRYTIQSIDGSCMFQLYSNNTKTWSNTTTFLQTDINDGMIRILPPLSFQYQCTAGTATPFTGSIAYTAQDVWTRTASGTVSFAVLCCPNTTQTISPSLSVASVGASPSTATQYCTVPMPGYYSDALSGIAKPCPYGTFKPQVGGGAMRDVCFSCPDGATTSSVASTSWSQCTCQYCYIGDPITVNATYTFSTKPLISSPHVDRPVLFTTAFSGFGSLYLAFTPYLLANGTVNSSLSPFYELMIGGTTGPYCAMRSSANGNDELWNYNFVLGPDIYTQVWYFYWQGYRASGLVPTDVDLKTSPSFFRDNAFSGMLFNTDYMNTPAAALLTFPTPMPNPGIPILDIGIGTSDNYQAQFKNMWNIQFDDMIDDYQLVAPRSSLQLSSTFAYNVIPQMSVTLLPADSLNATWTLWSGTINCTWINHSLNYYDFDLATPFVGSSVTWAISDGTSNVSNWANGTSFTHAQMTAGLVYLRVLAPQSSFSPSGFSLPFTVRNPMIRVATYRISYLNFTMPPLPSNGALEISSWNWITGGDVGCVNPTYPTLGTFASTATPGSKWGAGVAMLGNSIYLFGGHSCSAPLFGNDLWQFNLTSGLWGWISGSSSSSPAGVYGTKGTPAAPNVPQGRAWASMVADSSRSVLWLFGGAFQSAPSANDMWQYNPSTGYWTWAAGQASPTCGTIQTSQNEPCSTLSYGGLVMDGSNRVVLFGTNAAGWNSPLWRFDPVSSTWSLLNPSSASNANDWVGSDGLTGIIGGRSQHQLAITPENQLYVLFGFNTSASTSSGIYDNSVWRYNVSNAVPAYWQRVGSSSLAPAVGLTVESATTPRSRGLFAAVADAFGNIYASSGQLSYSDPNAADLLVFNILANTWMRLAGPDAVQASNSFSGSNVVKGAASSLNQLRPSDSNALFLKTSSNPRYYTLYAIVSTNLNTGVYSFDVYVPPSTPVIKSSGTMSYERWGANQLILNSSLLRVVDYDSPASQLAITITSSPNATFLNLVTGLPVTSFTYDTLTNGSQIAMVVVPSFVGSSFQFSWTVTDLNGNSASGLVTVTVTCSSANTSPTCLCLASFGVTNGVCATCASNTYKAIDGNFACATCPTYSTTSGLTGQTSAGASCRCNAGYYGLTSNGTTCAACPADTFKNTSTPNVASCTSCPNGGTTSGATAQTACVAQTGFTSDGYGGFMCLAGYTGTSCTACAAGTYKTTTGPAACTSCPASSTSKGTTGQATADGACSCNVGYYGLASGGTTCTACPADTFRNTTTPNVASCTNCPNGGTTSGATAQTACTAKVGFTSDGYGGFMCLAGYTGTSCSACAAGSYKSTTGPAACTSCPANSASKGVIGQSTADGACSCVVGYYGFTSGGTTCSACPADTFKNTTTPNVASCTSCPNGGTTSGATAQSACGAQPGFMSDGYGGFMCLAGYTGTLCTACSAGTFKTTTGPIACTSCPTNSTSTGVTGQSTADGACSCNVGYYGLTAGGTSCSACPADTFKNTSTPNVASCSSCPNGGTTNGATAQTTCVAQTGFTSDGYGGFMCQAGYAGFTCTPCAAGSYKSTTGPAACATCPADTYLGGAGNTSPCNNCPQGSSTYGVTGRSSVTDCAALSGWTAINSTYYTCQFGYTYSAGSCVACAADTYKNATGVDACTSCPLGSSTSGGAGRVSAANCSALTGWAYQDLYNYTCAVGYGYTAGNSSCTACPVDTYKNVTDMNPCSACQSGYSTYGAIGLTACANILCNPGYGYTANNQSCTICPVNMHQDQLSAKSCAACPVGSGTLGLIGSTNLTNCSAMSGFVKVNDTTFGCATGSEYNYGSSTCSACVVGYYQDSVSLDACMACPVGATTASTGATALSSCVARPGWARVNLTYYACDSGFQFTAGNSTCTSCLSDTFKSTVGFSSCLSCPLGSSTNGQTGSSSIYNCTALSGWAMVNSTNYACSPGYGFAAANSSCTVCPIDNFKSATDLTSCSSCPQGSSTSGQLGGTTIYNCTALSGWTMVNSTNYACSPGYGFTVANSSCTVCPTDSFKSTTDLYSCSSCPLGSSTGGLVGRTNINNCVPLPGFVQVNSTYFACDQGYGYASGNVTCNVCLGDTWKSTIDLQPCAACPTGSSTFGNLQATSLSNCTALDGWQQNTPTNYTCMAGYGYTSNNASCSVCPMDWFKPLADMASCEACLHGSTTNGQLQSLNCSARIGYTLVNASFYGCLPGLGYNSSTDLCDNCTADSYSAGLDVSPCQACPTGSSTNGVWNSTSIANCTTLDGWYRESADNYTCAAGYGYVGYNSSCTICQVDYFKSNHSMDACSPCASGTSTFGASGLNACANFSCSAGTTYQALNNSCADCAQDTYKNTSGIFACTACPTGSTTLGATGGYFVTNCTALAGWYQLGAGNFTCNVGYAWSGSTCVPCSVGYYKDTVGIAACSGCPVGSTVNGTGSTGMSNCTAKTGFQQVGTGVFGCLTGLQYNATQKSCGPCPVNTYKATVDLAACSACPIGSYTNGGTGGANVAACVALPGFVATGTGSFGCPPGSQVVNGSLCIQCPSGSAQSSAGLGSCNACSQGTSTFGMSGFTSCLSTQFYQSSNGGGIECTAGYTSDGANCAECPTDSFKADSGNASCTACPSGQGTLNQTAQTSQDACSAIVSASTASQSASGAAIGAAIGGAVAGIVVLSMLVLFVALRMRKNQKRAKTANSASRGASLAGTHSPNTATMMRSLVVPRPTGAPTVTIRPLSVNTGFTINNGTRTFAFAAATATCSPTHNLAAFPGFLLINSRSGFIKKRQIAEGGFGKIFTGELVDVSVMTAEEVASGANRKVAIKLFGSVAPGPSCVRQMGDLENEAAVLYALSALPNVTKLIAVSKEPELALVLKLYEDSVYSVVHRPDSSFRSYALNAMQQSWIRVAQKFSVDLLAGVDGMHSLSVCHLDIKPHNLLLERLPNNAFRLVIGDFGLARISKNTAFDNIAGRIQTAGFSVQYAAPEAYNVVRLLDERVLVEPQVFYTMDVYSTTVTMWEIFARRAPLADLVAETAELELVQGKRPALDQLPVPANSVESAIMQSVTPLFEQGWSSLQGRRPRARALYTAIISACPP